MAVLVEVEKKGGMGGRDKVGVVPTTIFERP